MQSILTDFLPALILIFVLGFLASMYLWMLSMRATTAFDPRPRSEWPTAWDLALQALEVSLPELSSLSLESARHVAMHEVRRSQRPSLLLLFRG